MYASLIPSLVLEEFYDDEGVQSYLMEGGLFHDGRQQPVDQAPAAVLRTG